MLVKIRNTFPSYNRCGKELSEEGISGEMTVWLDFFKKATARADSDKSDATFRADTGATNSQQALLI